MRFSNLVPLAIHRLCSAWLEVLPDLEKFMESLNTKMSSVFEMVEILKDEENPPPMDRFQLNLF